MRRRDVLTLIGGGVATACPMAARGQQPPMPEVGLLLGSSAAALAPQVAAFHEGLRQAGFADGPNVAEQYRYAGGQLDRVPALAPDLVRRRLAASVAGSRPGTLATKR